MAGDAAPAAMNTLGVTVALDVSPLASATVTPPAGAGKGSVTANAADWPCATVTVDGRLIAPPPWAATVMLALAFGKPGALAVIEADPGAKPVT